MVLIDWLIEIIDEFQNQNREEIKRINLELSRVDASAGRLQDVDRDIRNTVRTTTSFIHFCLSFSLAVIFVIIFIIGYWF